MRVLVIENYQNTPLGLVAFALDEARVERVHLRPFAGDAVPASAAEFEGLVLLGGAQNALDDENHPWFGDTLDLIRDFERNDKAVLGICLGAQLIARAFEGENRIGGHYEFGWHEVALNEAGRSDPVFSALPAVFPIFEWHDDHFSLPPDAIQLARTAVADNQAFRIGRATYGTQFHFEADQAQIEHWSGVFADLLSVREPDWPARHPVLAAAHGEAADAAGLALARAWVAAIRPNTA